MYIGNLSYVQLPEARQHGGEWWIQATPYGDIFLGYHSIFDGIYHQHCHNLPKHVQCPELAVFHGISGIMMNYDHPSYFGRPMRWWTSTGDHRCFVRPVRCASLRTWWGRPWSPLCSSLWGVISRSRWLIQIVGPRGLGVSQCSMVFRIVWFIWVERWLKDGWKMLFPWYIGWKMVNFISFAFKKHVDVHTHTYI